MLKKHRICASMSRWNRGGGLLFAYGVLVLTLGASVAQRCAAQTVDPDENQANPQQTQSQSTQDRSVDQQSGQSSDAQFGQQQDQDSGDNQNQQTGRGSSRQMQQNQNSQSNQPQTPIPPKPSSAPLKNQQLTAEQLISILEQEPEIMVIIKSYLAQPTEADPTSITDESVYEQIRQNASLRDIVTGILIRRRHGADMEALNPDFSVAETLQPTKPSTPGSGEELPYDNPDSPQTQRRLSPYKNLPSLRDLYSQFPTTEKKLRRFGTDAFTTPLGSTNQVPMDLPAGPDYVLGAGDSLTVNLWGGYSSRLKRTIDRQGQIALPEAGTVMVNGLTMTQAQAAIQTALNVQFQGEHVEISLERLRTVRVYVVGDVQRPGAYDVSSLSTCLSALYAAGGPTSRGSLRALRQYRGGKLVREVDLYDLLLRGVRSNDDRLLAGDTILIPPVGPQVTVEGAVRRPAIYELNGEKGLNQVLDLAGGVLASGSLKQIDVERIDAHQSRTMFSVQLADNQGDVNKQLGGFAVRDGDDVNIRQIQPYNSQAVFLEGHVIHPGKYSYREGMTLSDIVRSYQDLMPEPADHAEIVRLRTPDFRPITISVDLPDMLVGNQSIPLEPFDLIRIYGRYESDAPSVEVKGDVLRPGKYPMSQGMTASELVKMAGGFRRSAARDLAEISSYDVNNGLRVEVNHRQIEIQKAIDGDKSADIQLKPGDVVGIRRIAGWQDIGATVTVSGEVQHPGSYGIQARERLSSVLRRAGGFRDEAYPYASKFERVQVRELNEQARLQMIRRIQDTPVTANPKSRNTSTTPEQEQKSLDAQRQQILMNLRSRTANGRMVINISSDISRWENTPADIELRAGDTLVIPKKADFVMISGQVYNPVAISYVPGKKLGWYFKKAGGTTSAADKKRMYLLRADGSVLPRNRGLLGGDFMGLKVRPGDGIVVPEKIVGPSQTWDTLQQTASTLSDVMIPLAYSGVI